MTNENLTEVMRTNTSELCTNLCRVLKIPTYYETRYENNYKQILIRNLIHSNRPVTYF